MKLPDLHFDEFPDFNALKKAVAALAEAAPTLVKVECLGHSREGREILLVTLNDFAAGTPEERPAFYVQGDIHALEFSRMHIVYAMKSLLQKHAENGLLSRTAFYFIPSINPDGVEEVVRHGVPFIRSRLVTATDRPDTLYPADVDGDGKILWMRWIDPDGPWAIDPEDPRLLVYRTAASQGPFYRMVPEGLVNDWSGTKKFRVLSGADWNRSHPVGWDAGPCYGGILPMNEPELRLVAAFLESHDNLCGALSLHVGGGCLVSAPNRIEMSPRDTALLQRIAQEYTETMGHPLYWSNHFKMPPWSWEDPSSDRPGTFVDYVCQALGIPGFDLELDGLYNSINFTVTEVERIRTFEEYHALQRRVMKFYDGHPEAPALYTPWKKIQHPQLGEVEVGGLAHHVLFTRLISEIPAEGERLAAFLERFAQFSPRAAVENVTVVPLAAGGLFRITATPVNAGSLPTHLLGKGTALWWKKVPRVTLRCAEGVTLLSGPRAKETDHLAPFSSGEPLEWVVKAPEGAEVLATVTFDAASGGRISRTVSCTARLREAMRTNPDFLLYAPQEGDTKHYGNENVTVIPLGNGRFTAFWLQSACEQSKESCCVVSHSTDGGRSWSEPRIVAGSNADPDTGKNRINHTTAVRNQKGRIYLFLSRNSGHLAPHENGIPFVCYSDDGGEHFSQEVELKFPHAGYDDPAIPTSWITFQPPVRLSNGKYAGGVSKYASRKDFFNRPSWTAEESCCEMYLIDNLDDNPEPEELRLRWTAFDDTALTFSHRDNGAWHVMQEPSLVELPDGRLFAVARTNSGSPCWAISPDGGETWGKVQKLHYEDGGQEILHPLSPCPIYRIGAGEFVLFIHNHDGHFGPWGIEDSTQHRRPLYMVYGLFDPEGEQPIRFGTPLPFADNGGRPLGEPPRADMALYGSLTFDGGEYVLWYPDRKHFLCGKKIDPAALRSSIKPVSGRYVILNENVKE